MAGRIVCFGELLLRFTSPGHERLMQSPKFNVHFGGAEANVAVSLARFVHDASMVSAVPDNPFGHSILSALKAQGVDTSNVVTSEGRMGLYFLETGAVLRPSRIVYDRANSVFAGIVSDQFDWTAILSGCDWLHISGITPAVGEGPAKAALAAINAAKAAGANVSFDGNYREALWKSWGGDGPAILKQILSQTDLAFINERDIGLILGTPFSDRAEAIETAFETFPALERIAATVRDQDSVSDQSLTGEFYTRSGIVRSRTHKLTQVIDRIGGGDAFAAGVLHGLIEDLPPQDLIEFATAASVIKHSIPGDWNLTNLAEVEDAMNEMGLDVKR